jgi:hypothetical protein
MSVIKTRTRGKRLAKNRARLDYENNETLYAYAQSLGQSTEYELNELVEPPKPRTRILCRWRAAHPQSCVPRPAVRCPSDAPGQEPTTARPIGSTGVLSVL